MAQPAGAGGGPEPLVVLITGCSEGGIGYSLAQAFAAHGCRVAATARRLEAMRGLERSCALLLELDVISPSSIAQALAAVRSQLGRIDLLVNMAGVVVLGPAAEVPMRAVRAAFDTNVIGLLELCQAAVPIMAAQQPSQAWPGGALTRGRIINVGSLTGFTPVPFRGIYSATKAAVMRLTDALRVELQGLGIGVCLAAPGFINTHARQTAQELAQGYESVGRAGLSLWAGWFDALQQATAKRLQSAVPADTYAQQLVAVALRPRMPRHWVGPCGTEWALRWLPLWLQDLVAARVMGLHLLQPGAMAGE